MNNTPDPKTARTPRVKEERDASAAEKARILEYVAVSVPEKHRLATQRALLKQVPKSTAIKVKCLQCCGYQREEIKVCAVITCALHPYRPYQTRDDAADAPDSTE